MFLFYLFIFLFGLIIGSFLNVVIFRLESGEQIVGGRSHCQHCSHVLSWYDLFPVLSFLALLGKCRYCHRRLSMQYPLVELATAIMFISVVGFLGLEPDWILKFGFNESIKIFYYWFIVSSLIVIFVYDLRHYIIPDSIIYLAIGVSLACLLLGVLGFNNWDLIGHYSFGNSQELGTYSPFISGLLAAILAGGFFFAIVVFTKGEGMGGGDVKLVFLMGLVLGWPKILLALFIAFTVGAICGIILMFIRKKTFKSAIPFGPFLVLGTFIALFWGNEIVRWYGTYLY